MVNRTQVGDLVVCILDDFQYSSEQLRITKGQHYNLPRKGHIYTVSLLDMDTHPFTGEIDLFYGLKELPNEHPVTGYPMTYHWNCFRPVDNTAIDIFRKAVENTGRFALEGEQYEDVYEPQKDKDIIVKIRDGGKH